MNKQTIIYIIIGVVVLAVVIVVIILALKPKKNDALYSALGKSYLDNEAIFTDQKMGVDFGGMLKGII